MQAGRETAETITFAEDAVARDENRDWVSAASTSSGARGIRLAGFARDVRVTDGRA
jgi:hypothetical protein